MGTLQNPASAAFAIATLLRQQRRTRGVLKHFSDAFVGLGGTFEVMSGSDLLLGFFALNSSRQASV